MRKHLLGTGLVAGALLLAGTADARPGGNTSTRTAPLNTIGVAAAASDNSVCSRVHVGVETWQCTPTVATSASAFHPVASTGGQLRWNGYASCEYRKRADGLNNDWSGWTSCGAMRSGGDSRTWGLGATGGGGSVILSWPQITNAETAFTTDCVEIRVYVSTSATASNAVESISSSTRFPSSGMNVSGICEGSSAY